MSTHNIKTLEQIKSGPLFFKFNDPSANEGLLNTYFRIRSEQIIIEKYCKHLEVDFNFVFTKKFWNSIKILYKVYENYPSTYEYEYNERNGDIFDIQIPVGENFDGDKIFLRNIIYGIMSTIWQASTVNNLVNNLEQSEWYKF